jgi:hypothetical protein
MSRRRAISHLVSIFTGKHPSNPDWTGIVEIANQELVTAELHDRIRDLGAQDSVPEDLRTFFRDVETRVADRMTRLSDTLHEALEALSRAGVTPLLLKGAALLAEHDPREGGPARSRIVSDLDLLVKAADMTPAVDALRSAGFAVGGDGRHNEVHGVVGLSRPSDVGAIDLHQTAPGPGGVIDIDQLFSNSLPVMFRGISARVPTPEDQILILVLHDQFQDGHFWRGGFHFRHLIDIARLSSGVRPVAWSALSAMCSSSRLRIALAAQLVAARRLAAARTPTDFPGSGWGRVHYWRQRAQFTWPFINSAFNRAGISKNVWGDLSVRFLTRR